MPQAMAALEEAYNAHSIRQMLDIVDELRRMGVKDDGIKLPSIVVVGDQSSGKTSVLESLSKIRLPSAKGLCTRVPLILRLTSDGVHGEGADYESTSDNVHGAENAPESRIGEQQRPSRIVIEYPGVRREILEDEVEFEVRHATNMLAGTGSDIKDRPITLTVARQGGPDLTLIDLPGITHVPVRDQPHDIYEQVKGIITEYIKPEESVILNVLSAAVDFATCESIRMSQQVDKHGERTLAVVTKIDMNWDGLLHKITTSEEELHLEGQFVLVRNRTEREKTQEAARVAEAQFFSEHSDLQTLERRQMLGIDCLADRLMKIQAQRLSKSFPKIQLQLRVLLDECNTELAKMPPGVSSPGEAAKMLFQLLGRRKDILEKLMVKGDFGDEDRSLQFAPRVEEKMVRFDRDLAAAASEFKGDVYRRHVLEVTKAVKGVGLPVFVPEVVFRRLVREEVDKCTEVCEAFIPKVCDYGEKVGAYAIQESMGSYRALVERAAAVTTKVIFQTKERCLAFVREMLGKAVDIVHVDPQAFKAMRKMAFQVIPAANDTEEDKTARMLQATLFAYWKIMHKRLADEIPIQIKFAVQRALLNDVDCQLMDFKGDCSLEMMELMREDTAIYRKRMHLQSRIATLQEKMRLVAIVVSCCRPSFDVLFLAVVFGVVRLSGFRPLPLSVTLDGPHSYPTANGTTPLEAGPEPAEFTSWESAMALRGLDRHDGSEYMNGAIGLLQLLGVKDKGTVIPKVVLVGGKDSGKTSVAEGLVGICLPRETLVPLIINLRSKVGDDGMIVGDEKLDPVKGREIEAYFGIAKPPWARQTGKEPAGNFSRHEAPQTNKKEMGASSSYSGRQDRVQIEIQYEGLRKTIEEDRVHDEVQTATKQLAGAGHGITNRPIQLTLTCRGAPDLTLIDLPPMENPQQGAVFRRVYLEEDCFILNVISSSATAIATCESTLVAKESDPMGQRTMVVITHVDLNPGAIKDFLPPECLSTNPPVSTMLHSSQGVYPYPRHGFMLVLNRTGTDREEPYERLVAMEQRFLGRNELLEVYWERGMFGLASLANKLKLIHAEQLARRFPDIRQKLKDLLEAAEKGLESVPRAVLTEVEAGSQFFLVVRDFKKTLERLMLDGDFRGEPEELHCVARMYEITVQFDEDLKSVASDFKSPAYRQHIWDIRESTEGLSLPPFMSNLIFKRLVREEVQKCRKICEELVPEMCRYAEKVAQFAIDNAMGPYPLLCQRAKTVTMEVMGDVEMTCLKYVKGMLGKVARVTYVKDEQFAALTAEAQNVIPSPGLNCEEHDEVRDMQKYVWAYWQIAHRRLAYELPTELTYSLQNALLEEVDARLMRLQPVGPVAPVSYSDEVMSLMTEVPEITQKRQKLTQNIRRLRKAVEMVLALPIIATFRENPPAVMAPEDMTQDKVGSEDLGMKRILFDGLRDTDQDLSADDSRLMYLNMDSPSSQFSPGYDEYPTKAPHVWSLDTRPRCHGQ
ncbi:hypothetical protein CBR_g46742 [Chara braunii]|uniref:Dynamin-type G domain-containing protein n=1 Tax=Chara braunii TaxID=69332 RepID=A0A388K440_CHABU|nr:hypothetical protein CBR_g46742 [Chara braunii]|eukprot:GBG64786.1 hypothetical protein CBR_g46742 [Chara braunii]